MGILLLAGGVAAEMAWAQKVIPQLENLKVGEVCPKHSSPFTREVHRVGASMDK